MLCSTLHHTPHSGPYVAELRDRRAGLTAQQQAAIITAYQQRGATLRSVGALHHVDPNTVANVLEAAGIPRRPRGGSQPTLTTEVLLEAGELYAQGHTQQEIARIQGVCRSTVHYRLHRLQARMRTRSQSAYLAAAKRAQRNGQTMRQLTTDGDEVDLRLDQHGQWTA